jgi:outer membrane protein TolC
MRSTLTVLFVLCLSCSAFAAEAKKVTLTEAVAAALAHAPELDAAGYASAAASAQADAISMRSLPTIVGGVNATRGNEPGYVFSSLLRQAQFTQNQFDPNFLNRPKAMTSYEPYAELQMPLFAAYQIDGAAKSATARAKAAKLTQDAVRQQVMLATVSAYVRVVSAQRDAADLDVTIARAESAVKDADALVENGMVAGCDIAAAKARLSLLRASKAQAQGALAAAKATFAIVLGEDVVVAMPSFLMTNGAAPVAMQSRPDVQSAQAMADAAKDELTRERRSLLPQVRLFGRQGGAFNDDANGRGWYTYGVGVEIPLIDPTYAARVRGASADAARLSKAAESVSRAATIEYESVRAAYDSSAAVCDAYRSAVEETAVATKTVTDMFKNGKRTIADLLEAESAAVAASQGYTAACCERVMLKVRLSFVAGALDDASIASAATMLAGGAA